LENATDRNQGRRRVLKVFTVVEKENSPRGIWLEIGVGSTNRDGSISAKLDCLPVSGSIHIREVEPRGGDNPRRAPNNPPPAEWREGGMAR
jgi:hypothetical protein